MIHFWGIILNWSLHHLLLQLSFVVGQTLKQMLEILQILELTQAKTLFSSCIKDTKLVISSLFELLSLYERIVSEEAKSAQSTNSWKWKRFWKSFNFLHHSLPTIMFYILRGSHDSCQYSDGGDLTQRKVAPEVEITWLWCFIFMVKMVRIIR